MFDALERIRAGLRGVANKTRAGWPAAAQSQRVIDLADLADRVDAELLRAVGQWDAEGCWAEDGAVNASSWLAQAHP